MKNYVSLLMILMLAVFSCNEKRDVSLQKCWSLAERGNNYQIFYNCDDDRLTLSWFRDTYRFYSNNKCEYLVLSPVDAHYMEEGVYDFDVETSILKIENMDGDIINRYIVVEIAHDQLKMVEL